MGFWVLVWIVSIIVATVVGSNRGSTVGGLLLGILLGPIGAIAAFGLRSMSVSRCPFCKEYIQNAASRCPRCQSDLGTDWAK